MGTSNGNCEQKLLSNRTLPVVVLTINPRIDDIIAPLGGASQALLIPATKEVVTDVASGGVWVNRSPQQVIQMVVYGSTPGDICNSISVEHAPSPVLIGSVTSSPPCGLSGIL